MNAIKPRVDVAAMYELWLSGLSIRNIGKHVGLGRMSVHSTLTRYYGKDACNIRKQSLSRVVYQEYGDMELAQSAAGTDGLFRTARAERNYSRCQTYDAAVANLSYEIEYPELELNLNTYLNICELTVRVLAQDCIYNNRLRLQVHAVN